MEIYNVYVGKKHIDMIKATNEKDACIPQHIFF